MNTTKKPWRWEENGLTVTRSIALGGPGCHSNACGVLLYVKDGKLVKVTGDPDFPLSRGRLCPRCRALPEVVYHPDRLKYPLRRAGKRGENTWQRISWDEAYDEIVERFNKIKQEYGPESVIFGHGTGRNAIAYMAKLAFAFGSPNEIGLGPLDGNACYFPRIAVMAALFGGFAVTDCAQALPERYDSPAWKVPECILVWGNAPLNSNPDGFSGHWLNDCMQRGSKLIVIDPRKTWEAEHAEMWLQIRPGTDAALALAMLHVIINEKLYDEKFVREWTHGFDKLKERVQQYPPDKVSEITWIPAEQIAAAARMYAKARPAALQWGVALDHTRECTNASRALIALWSITGNMDVPGGNMLKGQLFPGGVVDTFFMGMEEKSRLMAARNWIGAGKYPLLDWLGVIPGDALIDQMMTGQPYPVKASWLQSTNTFVGSTADPRKTYDAFKKLDFNVVADLFMTPTAVALADIVLPVATYAERDGIATGWGIACIGTANQAIEPIGECKSDMEIDLELGKRLSPESWPWENVREMFDALVAPAGVTFTELRNEGHRFGSFEYQKYEKGKARRDGKPGFDTPTGKVELYSTVFERCGLDPLPGYEEPPESPVSTPELFEEYPLILITGCRTPAFFVSEHRQIPSLRRRNPDPVLEIHPQTAEKFGIKDGDWVYIENSHGRCRQRAMLTENIEPRVVSAQHSWWFPEKPGAEPELFGVWESNVNLLLPTGWAGKSGLGYPFKSQICRVYPVAGEDA